MEPTTPARAEFRVDYCMDVPGKQSMCSCIVPARGSPLLASNLLPETVRRCPQSSFGVDTGADDRRDSFEQEVACDFLHPIVWQPRQPRGDVRQLIAMDAGGSAPALESGGVRKCRHGRWDPVEDRRAPCVFASFDLFPSVFHLTGRFEFGVFAKHVGMTADQFPGHAIKHLFDSESPLAAGDIGMKSDVS